MADKQKVTLYLPPGLHRQLKIKAAVDTESMSAMVEKAIVFYLKHPEEVERVELAYGKTHQVHTCPSCQSSLIERNGEMEILGKQPDVLSEDVPLEAMEELVPC